MILSSPAAMPEEVQQLRSARLKQIDRQRRKYEQRAAVTRAEGRGQRMNSINESLEKLEQLKSQLSGTVEASAIEPQAEKAVMPAPEPKKTPERNPGNRAGFTR